MVMGAGFEPALSVSYVLPIASAEIFLLVTSL